MTPQDQLGVVGESRRQYDTFISHLSVQGDLRGDMVAIVAVVALNLRHEGSDPKVHGSYLLDRMHICRIFLLVGLLKYS